MLNTQQWIDETLRNVDEVRISTRELAELRRKAAAFDAGVCGFGVRKERMSIFVARHRSAAVSRANVMTPPGYVVPVRIVEAIQ